MEGRDKRVATAVLNPSISKDILPKYRVCMLWAMRKDSSEGGLGRALRCFMMEDLWCTLSETSSRCCHPKDRVTEMSLQEVIPYNEYFTF